MGSIWDRNDAFYDESLFSIQGHHLVFAWYHGKTTHLRLVFCLR
ncbi:hypothetical protein COLO4_31982 [Corchorus olitorius]|uniref:Uncharacterized protein n=1 Tax=Corchorus olitorius TaxID=93759 RepID=A0A1R3H303_9ROSI|nr:hypothetical protein COLO4_31982 [Corchorus olitorius]